MKIYRNGKVISSIAKPRNVQLQTDDVVELVTAGGGGYGPISERDATALKRDYEEEKIDADWLKNAGLDPREFE